MIVRSMQLQWTVACDNGLCGITVVIKSLDTTNLESTVTCRDRIQQSPVNNHIKMNVTKSGRERHRAPTPLAGLASGWLYLFMQNKQIICLP
ncbi:hypothetical protein EWN81_20725 [Salmonella enterica]|nr:hypothetical protein [Salmonella enterica subsp. enterica serovar Sundsvall]EAB2614448.1 hypothetical protein [Salmonella enterica]EAB7759966.1 hypothetical protein [Salmonella enterica subsp. enterica serovar Poona]EBR8139422.1 hypothetical protein [Salmonella enterica subsp. enterica serovar Oranienburg]EBX8088367.1 hypothetical protein [Salmonella enterica subsp. enterica serovar Choleraesuis]ECE8261255.1 hypothetical protein [Salmonella enterica subsp. enterica serovar Hvittingfoss]ECJ